MAEDVAMLASVNIDVAKERSKPRLEALLLADYASITASGKPDICGIFDQFSVDPEKKSTGYFYLYIRTAETLEGEIHIAVIDPNGKALAVAVTESSSGSKTRQKRLSLLQRLTLDATEEGEYWIDVSYMGQSLGGGSFDVKYREKDDDITAK